MRQYILLIDDYQPGDETCEFRVMRNGEEIYSGTDCLVPGMDAVKLAVMENLSQDPLD